jgi:hypothetical protein
MVTSSSPLFGCEGEAEHHRIVDQDVVFAAFLLKAKRVSDGVDHPLDDALLAALSNITAPQVSEPSKCTA